MYSEKCAKTYHVKKGDVVEVLSGVWKKETGKIVAVIKKTDRVVLEIQSVPAERQEDREEIPGQSERWTGGQSGVGSCF